MPLVAVTRRIPEDGLALLRVSSIAACSEYH